jgi:hypothetical protein
MGREGQQMGTRIRRITAALLLAGGLAATPVALVASPAGASATACSSGPHTYCAYVNGKGTHVNYVIGSFSSVSTICNWTITAEFFDTHNHWYKTYESKTHLGCWFTNSTQLNVNYTAKSGKMYSTLRSNGARVTSVGFSIHP